jgi:hypothetical protein
MPGGVGGGESRGSPLSRLSLKEDKMKRLTKNLYLIPIILFSFALQAASEEKPNQSIETAQYIIEQIENLDHSLFTEIKHLPDYKEEISGNQLLALKRLHDIRKNTSTEQIKNLESFLQIGLPTKRAFCSPLQAVLWILEKENDDQILTYSLPNLLSKGWIFTEQNRWSDYEVVTNRLNAPEIVDYYERVRFRYQSKRGKKNAKTGEPKKIFSRNEGNCADTAVFSAYCLKKAGYKTYVKNVHPSSRGWHAVCFFEDNNTKYIIDNGRPDKFLRRGIVPAEEYKMYHDKINLEKADNSSTSEIYSLQDNYGLLLFYLIFHNGKAQDIKSICKDIGLSGYEKYVKQKYFKALIDNGFISELKLSDSGIQYNLNSKLSNEFINKRYHRPLNASAQW